MSKKPCPGCGEVTLGRKAIEVCWDCGEKLNGYEKLEAQLREMNEKSNKTLKIIIGPKPHWNADIWIIGDKHGELARASQIAFHEIVMASSDQSVEKHDYKEADFFLGKAVGTSHSEAHRLIGLEVATAIKEVAPAYGDARFRDVSSRTGRCSR